MSSIFLAMNTANSALQADQASLETVGHNVANANTDGYTQQSAHLVASLAYSVPSIMSPVGPGQLGTGVTVQNIMRSRDGLLDGQFRFANQSAGQWSTLDTQMNQVQSIFTEPSPTGLGTKLNTFWNTWQQVADDPTNVGARSALQQSSISLVNAFNGASQQLTQAQIAADTSVTGVVNDVNTLTSQIANLNGQIRTVLANNQQPNDLMDQRDLLIDHLSNLVPITYGNANPPDGTITVNLATQVPGANTLSPASTTVGTPALVIGTTATALYYATTNALPYTSPSYLAAPPPAPAAPGLPITTGGLAPIIGGKLGSALQVRDQIIGSDPAVPPTLGTGLIAQLNTVVRAVAQAVNAIHGSVAGPPYSTFDLNNNPGGSFFDVAGVPLAGPPFTNVTTMTAANVIINAAIVASSSAIAASATTGAQGDGSVAQKIANVQNIKGIALSPLPNQTVNQGYETMISGLGATAQRAHNTSQVQVSVMNSLTNQRLSVGGVNLDEQMTFLVQLQHNYSAAARVVTAVDSMLETIVAHLGLGN